MNVAPDVRLVQRGSRDVLLVPCAPGQTPDPELVTTVMSTDTVAVLTGLLTSSVRVDGEVRYVGATQPALLQMDLKRSTGFHRLEAYGRDYWFATEDTKLKLSGIRSMLAYLQGGATGWKGQMMFSDGAGQRDAHVVYAWLQQHADRAIDASAVILAVPAGRSETVKRVSRRGGAGIHVPATLALIRSDPSRLLERHEPGQVHVDGQSYVPLRVVHRSRKTTFDTIPNRRVVWTLNSIRSLIREVREQVSDKGVNSRCLAWQNRIEAQLAEPLAASLARYAGQPIDPQRQPVELTDTRYQTTFDQYRDLSAMFGWNLTTLVGPRFSAVKYADQIFQAFAATVIAESMGMVQQGTVLGERQPAFANELYHLYLDSRPPAHVLRSWRHEADPPDDARPDIVVHELATGRVAVLDAKYRTDGTGTRASEDSRKEVTSYMGLYGLDAIGVLYPGVNANAHDVTGHGHLIREIPVTPESHTNRVEDAVSGLLRDSRYALQERDELL